MKKTSIIVLIALITAAALLFGACAKPPVDEMNNASTAVSRAENDADAATYAASSLSRARDALTRMKTEADAKRYDAAKTYAAEAVSAAEKAITDGRSGAARAKDEAAALVTSLRSALTDTEASLEAAQGIPNTDLDFRGLRQDLDTARAATDGAAESLAANKYQDAIAKGQTARGLLGDIASSITGAVSAVSRKK
jgi:hypothetical protein